MKAPSWDAMEIEDIFLGLAILNGMGAVKKTDLAPRAPIATLIIERAARAIKRAFPQIARLHLVGSRLRRKVGRDIDFVAVVEREEDLPGRNLTDIRFGNWAINLFFSLPGEVESHILEFGLGLDIQRWKRIAKEKGLKLNRFGLWKNSALVSNSMKEIASILGLPLKPHLVWSLENPF